MIYWLLAREVKVLKGELKADDDWDEVPVELFHYRNVD
jgi:small subunit ribosomal protein SAe